MSHPDAAAWIARQLGSLPAQADAALILRHAEREEISSGTFGYDVPLTARGVAAAEGLGAALAGMRPRVGAVASPVPRCVSTARAILRGAGLPESVALDRRLGDPGPFVVDEKASGELFLRVDVSEIAERQLAGAAPPAGMRATSEGVGLLLGLAAGGLRSRGRLDVYVTHDGILAVLVAYLYRLPVDEIGWPGYLDGLLMWRCRDRLHFAWGGLEQGSHPLSSQGDRLGG